MNDTPVPPAGSTAAAQSRPGAPGFWRGPRFVFVLGALVALLVVAVGLLWWRSSTDLSFTQREFARRIAEADARSVAATQIAKDAANALIDAHKQIAVLDAKISESQSQQYALEQMYQELSRNRDDIQLAELEQSIAAAAQQLQLSGNVPSALLALQNADARLARIAKPQFVGVRRAIARDIDRLKALPNTDVTGLAVKLDQVIAQVESMPTLIDEKQAAPAPRAKTGDVADKPPPAVAAPDWWIGLLDRIGREVRNLVRIREVNAPEALLLAPSQAYFMRENLKLRLLNARLQLLARNETGFRSDLKSALDWIGRYFDQHARQTQNALLLLRQLYTAEVSIDLPNLSESLSAVRNFRPGPGVATPATNPASAQPAPGSTSRPH